jgi:hypothetical protein
MPAHNKHEEHSGRRHGPAAGTVGFAEPDAIARRAYELFEKRGREMGHDLDDWLRAEHEVMEAKSLNEAE